MAIPGAGTWTLVKTSRDPERFMFLRMDPTQPGRDHVWTSTDDLDEDEARRELLAMGLPLATIARVFTAARAQFIVAAEHEH